MVATCWQSKQLSLIPFAISWVDSGGLEGVLWVRFNKNIIQLVVQDVSIKHTCGPFTKSAYLITYIDGSCPVDRINDSLVSPVNRPVQSIGFSVMFISM